MAIDQWLGLGALILLAAFVAFAFRQGGKVKPSGNDPSGGGIGGQGGDSGGHSGGDSGGGH
jgi:hypothetical protein